MSATERVKRRPAAADGASAPSPPGALPFRSDLMASLGALLNLWDSPNFHLEVPTHDGQPLDEPSHRMVRHLSFRGPMRPSALADELGTGRSNISKIIKRLEQEGLAARETDPDDSRATRVHLTPEGLVVAQRFYDLGDQLAAQVLEDWDPDDVALYVRLTERFTRGALQNIDGVRHHTGS